MPTNSPKINQASHELFTILLQNNLNEAEVVASFVQALTLRLAYDSQSIEELEKKLEKFPEIFLRYVRINLSTAQSAILAKQEALKGMN